jgi:hypothetical protein
MEPNWRVAFYETARGEVPARAYLDDCPRQAREVLLRIVVEVARSPPPSFRSPRHWRAMHGSMRGLYEARDRHGNLLYRLFCVVDALAPAHGHAHKLVTLIDGGTKPVRSEMPARVYRQVVELADDYRATRRTSGPR